MVGRDVVTQEQLKEVLHYDPATGVFVWRVRTSKRIRVGDVAGSVDKHGHLVIRVHRKIYFAHRLAWLYMTGKLPALEIDHRNGVRSDNRWTNLRDGTHAFNLQNQLVPCKRNRSGYLGVVTKGAMFRAQISIGGVTHYIGTYPTAEQAHAAYLARKRACHPGCTI